MPMTPSRDTVYTVSTTVSDRSKKIEKRTKEDEAKKACVHGGGWDGFQKMCLPSRIDSDGNDT